MLGLPLFLLVCAVYFHITNPFTQRTIIRHPYAVEEKNNILTLEKEFDLVMLKNPGARILGYIKSGYHIISNVYTGSKKATSDDISGIIEEIYAKRYNEVYPFLISGDHFSVLYARSLGIFYYPTMDPRIETSEREWKNRQAMYLKTTAYALDAFEKNGAPCTTIVPLWSGAATCINVYSYPSDSPYSVLFALTTMTDENYFSAMYPLATKKHNILHSKQAATTFSKQHRDGLAKLLNDYRRTVYDPQTGLIRKDIHLSGTKDIIRRQSSFYDNVVYWKTLALAKNLGIIQVPDKELADLKSRILKSFWYKDGGYFLEDLSDDSTKHKYYSSDWLIVLPTQFLDPTDPLEQKYYTKSVAYIQKEELDKPFGLKYQQDNRASRAFLPVRLFVRSYGGTAIWSFWGTEYIKALIVLGEATGDTRFTKSASEQLTAYTANIQRYKGFPEVYDKQGKFLSNLFYKSVRQTGWVINYDQARQMIAQ